MFVNIERVFQRAHARPGSRYILAFPFEGRNSPVDCFVAAEGGRMRC